MKLFRASSRIAVPLGAVLALASVAAVVIVVSSRESDAGTSIRVTVSPEPPAAVASVPELEPPTRIGPDVDIRPLDLALQLRNLPEVRYEPPPPPPPPPPATPSVADLPAGDRWVLVDLSDQVATLFVNDTAYHAAGVTTGKAGWDTPIGTFYIGRRVANETMTSAALGIPEEEEFYHLEDVLYTQYFTNEGHALHLNYWQPEGVFGAQATSHGCVGMLYADAELFWNALDIGSRVVVQA